MGDSAQGNETVVLLWGCFIFEHVTMLFYWKGGIHTLGRNDMWNNNEKKSSGNDHLSKCGDGMNLLQTSRRYWDCVTRKYTNVLRVVVLHLHRPHYLCRLLRPWVLSWVILSPLEYRPSTCHTGWFCVYRCAGYCVWTANFSMILCLLLCPLLCLEIRFSMILSLIACWLLHLQYRMIEDLPANCVGSSVWKYNFRWSYLWWGVGSFICTTWWPYLCWSVGSFIDTGWSYLCWGVGSFICNTG